MLKLDKVAIAKFLEAFLCAIEEIAFVGGTVKNLHSRGISIQRPIRLFDADAKRLGNCCVQLVCSLFATCRAPASLTGVGVSIVIDIKMVGDADLFLVA